ncbi:MAG: substrate-binding domain-containing protein, partial [Shewanella sp.]
DHQGNHKIANRLLDLDSTITAVFCQNDNIALAVYDVAVDRGLVIGQDLSIIGFDNALFSQHMRPSLTTINFPVIEMGQEAARGVLALVNEQHHSLRHKLIPELVIRNSVKDLHKS